MKFGLYSITLKGLDGVDWPGGGRRRLALDLVVSSTLALDAIHDGE